MSKKWTQKEFIDYVTELHTKIRKQYNLPPFDYSNTIFNGLSNYIEYKCPLHPDVKIKQLANSHKRGHGGCYKCNNIIYHFNSQLSNTEEFISKAKIKHQDINGNPKYDYSFVKYYNAISDVDIYCPKHDYHFKLSPNEHLNGTGCKYCGLESRKKYTQEEFISLCKQKQDYIREIKGVEPYDYSETIFNGTNNNCEFICRKHGKFIQLAESHLQGYEGCPECKKQFNSNIESISELEIKEFLKQNNIIFESNTRKIIAPKELDIYIPSKNIAIEFNGLNHHSELFKPDNYKIYHLEKTLACENQGIQLIHIFEDEWINNQEIVKSRLLNILGKSKWRLFARKLKIKQVPIEQEKYFFNRNHLQGYIPSSLCYGLYWEYKEKESGETKNYLVSAMSFGGLRKNLGSSSTDGVYEMYRFCNALNYSIVGAASKLFKYFLKRINPQQVISYADRRWSIDSEHNLYRQLGFEFNYYSKPGYFYTKGNKRYNRYKFNKEECKKLGCPENITEHEFMNSLGYYQIYDSGQLKYIYK